MKNLIDPRTLARFLYYGSPEYVRNAFWRSYLFYIKNLSMIKTRGDASVFELKYIDPKSIIYIRPSFSLGDKFENIGIIEDGDWDIKDKIKFEESESFKSLRDHFLHDVPLMETPFYKKILNRIEHGEILWGCHNKEHLTQRCKNIDKLYNSIKHDGYKTQRELGNQSYLDEVTANIGRDGDILFEEGHHRLAIAKLIGLERIPILITKRHSEWVRFKKEIISYSNKDGGKVYQPLEHPDLTEIPSLHSNMRWNLIKNHLPVQNGTILDIGAQWGYFSHKFEDIGFNCYAVENNPAELYFLKKLKRAENKKFNVISKSVLDMDLDQSFDIVLALNIFHHFIKTKQDFLKFKNLLQDINMKYMFFEPHYYKEDQMYNAYVNFKERDFINFILENSCLKDYKHIGSDSDRRNLYLLY